MKHISGGARNIIHDLPGLLRKIIKISRNQSRQVPKKGGGMDSNWYYVETETSWG